jgi:hypothetical protein
VQPGLSLTSDVRDLLLATGKIGLADMNYLAYIKAGYALANVDYKTAGLFTSSASGLGEALQFAPPSRVAIAQLATSSPDPDWHPTSKGEAINQHPTTSI